MTCSRTLISILAVVGSLPGCCLAQPPDRDRPVPFRLLRHASSLRDVRVHVAVYDFDRQARTTTNRQYDFLGNGSADPAKRFDDVVRVVFHPKKDGTKAAIGLPVAVDADAGWFLTGAEVRTFALGPTSWNQVTRFSQALRSSEKEHFARIQEAIRMRDAADAQQVSFVNFVYRDFTANAERVRVSVYASGAVPPEREKTVDVEESGPTEVPFDVQDVTWLEFQPLDGDGAAIGAPASASSRPGYAFTLAEGETHPPADNIVASVVQETPHPTQ